MRQALAVALQDYAGAVCWCRTIDTCCARVADQFYIVHDGGAQPFDGDLEDYAAWLRKREPRTVCANRRHALGHG